MPVNRTSFRLKSQMITVYSGGSTLAGYPINFIDSLPTLKTFNSN